MTSIVVKQGEDKIITVNVTDDSGAAVPLTGQIVRFRCRRNPSDAYLYDLENTSADHDDAANGITSFLLDKAISGPASAKLYYWELELEDESSGFISIQDQRGELTIKSSV